MTTYRPQPGEQGHCPSCKHHPRPEQRYVLCNHPDDDIRNLRLPEQDENRCPGYELAERLRAANGAVPNKHGVFLEDAHTEVLDCPFGQPGTCEASFSCHVELVQLADGRWVYGRQYQAGTSSGGRAPALKWGIHETREEALEDAAEAWDRMAGSHRERLRRVSDWLRTQAQQMTLF